MGGDRPGLAEVVPELQAAEVLRVEGVVQREVAGGGELEAARLAVELAGDGRDLARERVGPGLRDGGAGRCRGEDRERCERKDVLWRGARSWVDVLEARGKKNDRPTFPTNTLCTVPGTERMGWSG
jgi:hypothetical protein